MRTPTMRISEIVVTGRHRWDLGDINRLAASIQDNGLITPIAVLEDGRLVAGQRRLTACEQLGWDSIPVHIMESGEALALLRRELAENSDRKSFTPGEAVALGEAIEAQVTKEAEARHREGSRRGGEGGGKFPPPSGPGTKTRDEVGNAFGMSGKTYEAAKAVVRAVKDETLPPRVREVAQRAYDDMERTGKVSPAAKKVAQAKAAAAPRPNLRAVPAPKPLSPAKRRKLLEGGYTYRLNDVVGACRMLVASASTGELISAPAHLDPPVTTDELVDALAAVVDADEATSTLDLIADAQAALSRYSNALRAQLAVAPRSEVA